jgi:hypothetical protein
MNNLSDLAKCSEQDLLDQALEKETHLLGFYRSALEVSGYDVSSVIEQLVERTRMNILSLEEKKREMALLRALAEPMAD